MQITEFRSELNAWLDAHAAELAPTYAAPGTLDEHIAQMQRVKSVLYDAGWMRWGWPERVGGLGGSPMLRTELGAAIAGARSHRPGPVLTRRGAGADADRLRGTGVGRRRRAAAPVRRGAVVPGLLGTRDRQRPLGAELPRRPRRRSEHGNDVDCQRPEGVDEPRASTRTAACSSRAPGPRTRAIAASPRSSSTWTRPESRSSRSR